jgi:peptide/nickel transport system substrate-binding protein
MEITAPPAARPAIRRKRFGPWVAVLVVLALFGAACSSDDDKSDSGTSDTAKAAASDVDPTGVLKIATGLSPLGPLHFDPANSVVNSDLTWEALIFGTLLRWNAKGTLDGWLAKSYEVTDPQTVVLTLRTGTTFSDGTPLDAEAVKTSLLHVKNDAQGPAAASRHAGFKFLQDIVVDSPTQLTFKLNGAGASDFLESLAHREGAIVSPKQIGKPELESTPIGAGPFTVTQYTPDQILSLRKNEKFFDTDRWKLGGIDYVHTVDSTAAVNGLLAGTVDSAAVPNEILPKIEADKKYSVHAYSPDFQYIVFQVCPGKPPFDNEKFRQAVQLSFDRDSLNKLAFQGRAKPAFDLWPESNPNFNPETKKINRFDPEEAKKLLKESGVANPSFEMHYVSAIATYAPLLEAMQAQLKTIGINATISPDNDILSNFITPKKAGAMVIPGSRRNVDKYKRLYEPGAQTTLCDVARQDIMDIVTPTAGMAIDDPARAAAFKKADLLAANNANPIPLMFTVNYSALNTDRVGGTPQFEPIFGGLLYESIYIKK